MERPKCQVPNCDKEGLIFFSGKLICGECLHKLHTQEKNKQWEELLNATNKTSRD